MPFHPRVTVGERGQASFEWLAVVALVASMLGLGAALAQAGYVGRRVTREMARAICIVGAGDCARDREPCVVGSQENSQGMTVDLAFVHFGEDGYALVEHRSDGTVAVTVEHGYAFGVQAAGGASAELHAGGLDATAGGEIAASLIARYGRGQTWIVGSDAEAGRLLDDLDDAPEPDVKSGHGAWQGAVGAIAGLDGLMSFDVAHGALTFDHEAGSQVDRRTGHRTLYVQSSWTGEAEIGDVLGVSGGQVGETYAVELDAAGHPLDLRVIAAGSFAGSQDLPGVVQPVVGLLERGTSEDRIYEVTAHLDLTDARNLAAARELLDAVARRRATARPSQALRRLIDERGTVEARVLQQQTSTHSASLSAAFDGAQFGAGAHVEQRTQKLVAATSRGLDGQWLSRTDCV